MYAHRARGAIDPVVVHDACSALRAYLAPASPPTVKPKSQEIAKKATRTRKQTEPSAPLRKVAARRAALNDPVTPKPRARKGMFLS
jgi:hypothetical protein